LSYKKRQIEKIIYDYFFGAFFVIILQQIKQ
jgi:hypothetical protein